MTFTGTEALAPTQGIFAWEYLVASTPPVDCTDAVATLEAGETPPGTVYRGFQALSLGSGRNDFRLIPHPSDGSVCGGSATGTFVSLLYDSAGPPCVEAGCPEPFPALLATACAEGVTVYSDRKTLLELPIRPVP